MKIKDPANTLFLMAYATDDENIRRKTLHHDEGVKCLKTLTKDPKRAVFVRNLSTGAIKTFGPLDESGWAELLSKRYDMFKLYFSWPNEEPEPCHYLLSEREVKDLMVKSVSEPGYGTEWVWRPVCSTVVSWPTCLATYP